MHDTVSPPATETNHGNMDTLRLPPHSIQAEQSVLGGLMLDTAAWDQVADRVSEQDFYRREHQLIFRAIASLVERNEPTDVVTLNDEIEQHNLLPEGGGLAYLGSLAKDTPSAANIRAYADIVREHSIKRQLIRVGTEIADSGFQTEGRKSSELLDLAELELDPVRPRSPAVFSGRLSRSR